MRTETEVVKDWVNYFKASPAGYQANALLAVLRNDGERILAKVLRELQLEKTVDFCRVMAEAMK